MSSRKSHILLKKHPLAYIGVISRHRLAQSHSTLQAQPGGISAPSLCRLHRYIPALSCTAGARQAFALNPKHLPCFFYATHMLLFELLACTATCKFCLIHTSLGIHVFSFTLPLSLPFSHTYSHWHTGGLISQHHTCSLRLSGCLQASCSQPSLKHTVWHQRSHMHHPKCPGAGGAATGTEQQAAPKCSSVAGT